MVRELPCKYIIISVVVKDLRLKDEDKDKDMMSKDEDKEKDLMYKDKDLKTGPRGSSRTRTFLEDKNTAVWGSTVRSTWTWTWPGHNGK